MNAAGAAVIALGVFAGPRTAHAHAVIEGVGGLPGGLLHPLLVPAQALLLVALGLMAGQQSAPHRRVLFVVFAAAAAGAIVAVTFAVAASDADLIVLAAAGLAGVLAAAGRPLPLIVPAALAAPGSAALMLDSVPAAISTGETLLALMGTALSATLMLMLVAGIAADPKPGWRRIGVRILAAWAAAAAILVLALRLAR